MFLMRTARSKEMEKLRSFDYALLAANFTLAALVHAQDPSGFISIDCGMPAGSDYIDKTGIKYISDEKFTDSGRSKTISREFKTLPGIERQYYYVRSFPEGARNCYVIPIGAKNDRYLIRARFMYGNYDNQNSSLQFDLYLGVNLWKTVTFDDPKKSKTTEIIHVLSTKYIFVCLVNTGKGTPFISALEVRLLNSSLYTTQSLTESLVLEKRLDFGSNITVRYKDDIYDRIWRPEDCPADAKSLSTSFLLDAQALNTNPFRPPPVVMSTACIPRIVRNDLNFYLNCSKYPTSNSYLFMHFAEVELIGNQTREFNIFINGNLSSGPVNLLPRTVSAQSPLKRNEKIQLTLSKTAMSDLPPIINAIEIYIPKEYLQLQTDLNDIHAIINIKSKYKVKKNWQGDPCAPNVYRWDGLNCHYDNINTPRIVSLNMSSSGLTGELASYFADLTSLESLDLSDNSLTGIVPDFLSQLQSLRVLNLRRNQLTGSLPAELMERSKNGFLNISVEENPNICLSASCKIKKNKFVVPTLGSLAALFALIIALAIFIRLRTWRNRVVGQKVGIQSEEKNDSFSLKTRKFTYSDILRITNNFERVLGRGGFGTVYHGHLDDAEVAVKMLSSSSAQGYRELLAEVKLLLRAHHRNLTTFIGYCMDGTNMGLIYEYMAKGSLEQYLSGRDEFILSWKERLQIAVDIAHGLEYLHCGCKPPIAHRDVKPENILLNENLRAKIADFGVSRIFSTESGSDVSTEQFAGTPGYLDPEYSIYYRLNEKSDVYSFGIVLLKVITTRPVISKVLVEHTHISEWVKSMLAEGDIRKIVDPRLGDKFNINSAWKAVELALACASHSSVERPTMSDVVMGLKECLKMEIARNSEGHDKYLLDSVSLETEISPLAR